VSKIFFLLNPSQPKRQWDLRELAAQTAHRRGWTARFGQVERDRPQSSERLLRQALEEDCSRLVVVGGDGTLHRAINGLHHLKKLPSLEVAVVPAGTCNDFARALGLFPTHLEEAFESACVDHPCETDLGRIDGELFINNAGFGRRITNAAKRAKPLKTLRSFSPVTLRATWEKGSIEGTFFMAMACNAPFFSRGYYFSKNPRVNDGLLDIFLLPTMAKWKLLPLLLMGRLGRPVRSRHMVMLKVHALNIESDGDLWPQADGEPPAGAVRRISFEVAPEKAMIIAPSHSKTISLWG